MLSATQLWSCSGELNGRRYSLRLFLRLLVAVLYLVHHDVVGAFNLPTPIHHLPAPVINSRGYVSFGRGVYNRRLEVLQQSSKPDTVTASDTNLEETSQQTNDAIHHDDAHHQNDLELDDTTKAGLVSTEAVLRRDNSTISPVPELLVPTRQQGPFLFPWSFWMKIRSAIPHMHHDIIDGSSQSKSSAVKHKKRRWEVPLTSKPFQGVEDLRSTVVGCMIAITIYFFIGTVVFPLLEPKWTFIDGLYFSVVSLTTVGYGDIVVSGGNGLRAMFAKLFVLAFNVYAVCISVSALGIIAKLALAQERKLMTRAKERARQRLIKMFDSEHDDEEEGLGVEEDDHHEEDEDDEQCKWADRVNEKKSCGLPDEPETILGALLFALRNNLFNFVVLAFMAGLIRHIEGWGFIDMLYYWNCTATTIGFGDICPQSQLGRLLAIVFIPLSVVTLGEVIASVFAFVNGRIAAKAEKDFLRREITLSDLEYLDVNDDGKVCELDFITFMLAAMQKVDRKTMQDLQRLFRALDAGKDGFLQKEDLIELRQRKRLSKRLKREARKRERWFEARYTKKTNKKWFGWSF